MTDSGARDNFFNAAKRLIDSEIELVKIVESSRRTSQRTVEGERTMSRAGRNNKQADKPVTKNSKVKASAALVAAKREAAQKKQSQSKKLDNFFICDIYQTAIEAKKMLRGQTGLTYDRSMAEHRCTWDENHPECPERFTRIMERCEELGLVERCKFVEPRIARNEEILMKHTQSQIDVLAATDGCEDTESLEKLASRYDAIYVHPSTYKLSLLATGSTINLLEKICRGEVQNGMAIIRPPGHHAMKSEYCGYCFFNNVAIGAEKMLRSNIARKILIVDWDVHHGQATQQMFYDDPRVVYFSIHRYENGEFWPNLMESDYHYVGANDGAGYNFNVPLNKNGMTNGDYLAIFQQVLLPMAYEFQPDLVIISAGFDCAIGCPEGEMEVTPGFFAHLLSPLMALANGRVAVVLEGGYCLDSLSEAAALTLRTLLGDPCPPYQNLQLPSEVMRDTILNVIYAHKAHWKCFQYQEAYSINSESDNHEENNRHLPVVVYKGDETKPIHYETRDCYPVQSETVLRHLKNRLNALKKVTNLSKAPSRVSIVYDERMLKHRDTTDASHPEKPDRISSIFAKHEEYQLLNRCHVLKGREATEEELLLAHTASHVNDMRQTCSAKPGELRKKGGKMNSVFLHADTWSSACVAVGSVLRVVDGVLNGESQSGVAIVRPPGHHADDETACGFCIFNNIAVAARYATQFHHLKRVLIVDWDIHHGNGTQTILADDPKILYVSIHRYDNAGFFPNSKEANYTFVGTGPGEGYTVNIPWNRKRMGDAEYIAAFQQIVMPIAYQFNPELVLISAGFDACVGDPLGGYNVSPEAYGHLTHWLSSLANGRIVIALEGGYNVNSISYAMTMCTKALLGDPMPPLGPYQPPCPSAITTIQNVLKVQKQYWPNLSFQVALPGENVLPEARITRAEKGVDLASPLPETKIAFDEIENEKIEISMRERQRLETITAEEMVELQREIERMAIVGATKECVNPSQKNLNDGKHGEGAGPSGDGQNEEQGEAAGGATNASLLDYLSDNMQALVQGEMFAVVPLRDCPHLDTVADVPRNGIGVQDPCQECGSTAENWICLRCYTVHCARSVNQHAITHGQMFEHPLTLSFSDLSVWCYGCEAYIDNPRLFAARNAAHLSKFNHELPWTYDEDSARARE